MKTPVRSLMIRLVIWYGLMAALLFGSAGTLKWGRAWLYLMMQTFLSTKVATWLHEHNPELLKERMTFLKRTARDWDKTILVLITIMSVPMFCLPGLDAVRYQWSHMPLALTFIGFGGIMVSFALIFWVVKENPYLSRVVEIQKDRGHKLISTGPYQYVRHPMYLGSIVWLVCFPLALGSWTAFLPCIYLIGLTVVRTGLEDRTLHEELEGYPSYANKVKYRLIPRIW